MWCAMPKLAAQPGTKLFSASNTLARWNPSYIILVDSSMPCSLPMLLFVAGGFWAIIFSHAARKMSWAGCDPAQCKMAVDRSFDTTGIAVQAQLLTA